MNEKLPIVGELQINAPAGSVYIQVNLPIKTILILAGGFLMNVMNPTHGKLGTGHPSLALGRRQPRVPPAGPLSCSQCFSAAENALLS